MARLSRAELKRMIDKLPDSELENARQALQTLIGAASDEPEVYFYLPDNGRGPARELPHVSRTGRTTVVIYDPTKPQPTPDEIRERLQPQESTGAAAEREWQESETDNRGRSQQG